MHQVKREVQPTQTSPKDKDRKIYRFNVIGAGMMGQEHIRVTNLEGEDHTQTRIKNTRREVRETVCMA